MAGPFHAPPAWLGAWVKSRAAVVYGKAVPTTTHKNSNRLSAEDRDAHTLGRPRAATLTDERWHTVKISATHTS